MQRERASVFCMKVIFAIWVLLLIVPARSEQSFSPPDRKGVLPELQKAVGNEWSVTALPDGYLFTYRPLVNFYPAISENSKLSDVGRMESGRMESGRMDHLKIKITYLRPPSIKNVDEYNAFWLRVQDGVPGFYECDNAHWCIEYDGPTLWTRLSAPYGQTLIDFCSNVAPDQLIPPGVQEDVYEHTLDNLAAYFHYVRCAEPSIED